MATADITIRPSHRWVADKLGYSIPGVSRIRSGSRNPTLSLMNQIHEVFEWDITEQVSVENYPEALEKVLAQRYHEEMNSTEK